MKRWILFLICISGGLAPSRAEARAYRVMVDSLPRGADIFLEAMAAGAVGKTPHTFKLKRGRYTFFLKAPGYETFTRTVEIKRNARFTFTMVALPPPATLAIGEAAGSAVAGAEVKINGKAVGKVPLTVTLQPGRYLVEVVKEGRETFRQWKDVSAGQRSELVINLKPTDPGVSALLVSSNITSARVFVDGKDVGAVPALVEKIKPGKRAVEVRAAGYIPRQKVVEVAAGKTTRVRIQLQPDSKTLAASGGTLFIIASESDVEVVIDGTSRGKAPVKISGLVEGSHVVEGRKPGMTRAEQTVSIKKGEYRTIKLTLMEPVPPKKTGAIRVISPVRGAHVLIDGTLSGKTPHLRHQLDPGPHFVTVRKKGYAELIQTVEVKAGQITELKAALKPQEPRKVVKKAAAPAAPVKIDTRSLASFSAHLVPPRYITADLSMGFPHLIEARLTSGLFSLGNLGLDGGVEFRTYGAVSEVGIHTKFRVLDSELFALAMLFHFGGGGGPKSRSTVYANLGVIGTMRFKGVVHVSARAYFNFYTDRHCPEEPDDAGELAVCRDPDQGTNLRERDGGTRFLLSGLIEVAIHERFNLFGIFEGAPWQGNRRAYQDAYAEYMPMSDPAIYGRIGASFKY